MSDSLWSQSRAGAIGCDALLGNGGRSCCEALFASLRLLEGPAPSTQLTVTIQIIPGTANWPEIRRSSQTFDVPCMQEGLGNRPGVCR